MGGDGTRNGGSVSQRRKGIEGTVGEGICKTVSPPFLVIGWASNDLRWSFYSIHEKPVFIGYAPFLKKSFPLPVLYPRSITPCSSPSSVVPLSRFAPPRHASAGQHPHHPVASLGWLVLGVGVTPDNRRTQAPVLLPLQVEPNRRLASPHCYMLPIPEVASLLRSDLSYAPLSIDDTSASKCHAHNPPTPSSCIGL